MALTRLIAGSCLLVALAVSGTAMADTAPADNNIKSAQADIARFEAQAASFTGASKSSIRRTLKLLTVSRQRLDGSPNKTHASWQEADQRFTALQNRLQTMLEGGAATSAAGSQGSASAPASSAASASATKSAATSRPASSGGKQLVSGQRVQVKKLARDIENARGSLVTTGPSALQDGRVVAKYNAALKKYADALSRYKEYDVDPDIGAAVKAYQGFVASIKMEYARAKEQLASVGDAQARLAAVDASLRANQPPGTILLPFNEAQAKAWVAQLSATSKAAKAATAEVNALLPVAYLPADAEYSPQRVNSLLRWADESRQKVKDAVNATQEQLKHSFEFADKHELPFFRTLDPADEHQKANMFLREGAEAGVYERLDKQRELALSFAAFYQAFGKEAPAAVTARIDEIAALRQRYSENRIKALGDSRLPKPASTDAAQLAIASEILANPEYKFGKHGPIVLTTDKIVTREEEVSRDTIKDVDISLSGTITMSGTRETWHYKWDEFKFATPLQHDDGQWYIWWITAKKYESGWERTPIGKWVSGRTTQGSLILEKNF